MKIRQVIVFVILVSAVLSQFCCQMVEDLINPNDGYGEYLSVKLRIKVTFKGLNSSGKRKITIDGDERILEDFFYDQNAAEDDGCTDATKDMSHSFEVTVNSADFEISLEYLNWDFVHFSYEAVNYKLLCSEWSAEVLEYEFEEGKNDPGIPDLSGFEELLLDVNGDCQNVSETIHDCLTAADISLQRNQSTRASGVTSLLVLNRKLSNNNVEQK